MLGLRLDEPVTVAAAGLDARSGRLDAARARSGSREPATATTVVADPARPLPRRRRDGCSCSPDARPEAAVTAGRARTARPCSPTMRSSMSARAELSERQREILTRVVEEYVATSAPVGSKLLVERTGFAVSASTVRAELAELERLGLLTHPHTSAGRVPTEAGYRVYVDGLLARQEPRPAEFPLELGSARAGGRGGAPGDDRDAVPGDAAARARLGAAARGGDGPARRRAPAAAERRRRRRDHVDRRGDEAALHVPASRSIRAS